MVYLYHYDSPIGRMTMTVQEDALTGIWFDGQRFFMNGIRDGQTLEGDCSLPVLDSAKHWLDEYFSGRNPAFLPVLRPAGTPFCQLVWHELLNIPYGTTSGLSR